MPSCSFRIQLLLAIFLLIGVAAFPTVAKQEQPSNLVDSPSELSGVPNVKDNNHKVPPTPAPRFIGKKTAAFANHVVSIVILLFLSAVFAGLTMGIMGFDSLTLEIIADSGPKPDCNYAQDILPIRRYGHQTLCTLILANMLANVMIVQELNVLQDQLFAIIHKHAARQDVLDTDDVSAIWGFMVSTFIILIFTEVLPMALCKSKYALAVASTGIPLVRVAMVLLYPVAMPLGRMLDALLPHDAGQIYDRNELKKLMMLHYDAHAERSGLQHTEVKLLVAAMEFHEKLVKDVMTPVKKVFAVRHDDLMTSDLIERLWRSGRSRVPVEDANGNYCDILIVRDLITYSKGQHGAVSSTQAARNGSAAPVTVGDIVAMKTRNVPTVDEDMPLPSMLLFFQRVNTHMAIVHRSASTSTAPLKTTSAVLSQQQQQRASIRSSRGEDDCDESPTEMSQLISRTPSESCDAPKTPTKNLVRKVSLLSSMVAPVEDRRSAVGIITLEDVVEELIREEIFDEYDSDNIYDEDDNGGDFAQAPTSPTYASSAGGFSNVLRVPRPPRRRPRANFYSYYVHENEDIDLSEGQVWAAAYYLLDMCPAFNGWRVGYIKHLLDQIGTVQLRPFYDGATTPALGQSPTSGASPDFDSSSSSLTRHNTNTGSSPCSESTDVFGSMVRLEDSEAPRGEHKKLQQKKKILFHERQSISGNLPSRRGSLYHPPRVVPAGSPASAATSTSNFGATHRHNLLLEENHMMFAESAASNAMILYRKGELTDVMTVVLSGGVDILVGRDGFVSQFHSFQILGEDALMSNLYVPEFTAVVRVPTRLLRIPRKLYDALAPAATHRHGGTSKEQRTSVLNDHTVNNLSATGPRLIASRQSWANMNIMVDDNERADESSQFVKASPTTALLIRDNAYGTFDRGERGRTSKR
jgi:CBS domain containing-hemolysin-like protein